MAFQINAQGADLPPLTDAFSLARSTGLWFLGLAGIYLLYGLSVFLGLEGGTAVLRRVTMVLGPSTVAFSLLISPALFAAGVDQGDRFDGNAGQVFARRWVMFAVFAGIAFLLSTIGATIATSLMSPVSPPLPAAAAVPRPPTSGLARQLIPVSLAFFVLISGTAGTLVGHVTSRWRPLWCNSARWISGVTLMASFLLPFLATANAIAQHGTSPIWIIVNPLALPLVLTSALAVRERDALGLRLDLWRRRASPHALDPKSLDRIVTRVTRDPDSGMAGLTGPEREMATLAAAIRRIAGSRATLSESRVQEIVTAIVKASPAKAPEIARPRRSWFEPSVLGGFCTSWTCLAVGLLIVSPLGGVPMSVIPAVAVGFLGSAGIVVLARRYPGLTTTLPI